MASKKIPGTAVAEFAKRVRSILWREDKGPEKKTYERWQARVAELEAGDLSHNEAVVRASKEYPCLTRLFREYDVSEFDPHPEAFPVTTAHEPIKNAPPSAGLEQSHRQNLQWAIEAAGRYIRTGISPASTPNDSAWYLYQQALDEPKDFLGRFNQVETKQSDELEEQRRARRSGQRSIEEIEEMLEMLPKKGGGKVANL